MPTLAELRFGRGPTDTHDFSEPPRIVTPEGFFREADSVLDELIPQVVDEVFPTLEQHRGLWNPNGFLVLPLGIHPRLGTLRLHVWPEEHRRTAQEQTIHDHAWHIASRTIRGVYTDDLYGATEIGRPLTEEERREEGLLRVFRADYKDGAQQTLSTDGTIVDAQVSRQRVVQIGSGHHIEAGAFHLDTVPKSRLAATLVFVSPRTGLSPRILFDRPPERIESVRIPVIPRDLSIAKEQL